MSEQQQKWKQWPSANLGVMIFQRRPQGVHPRCQPARLGNICHPCYPCFIGITVCNPVLACPAHAVTTMPEVRQSMQWRRQLDLLSRTSLGLPAMAPALCPRLHATGQEAVQSRLDVPGGALQCTAHWMDAAAPGGASASATARTGAGADGGTDADADSNAPALRLVLATLVLQQPRAARMVREISALGLSPLQGRLALCAAACGRRAACAQQHQISAEALKKHLRRLYAACGVQEWSALQNHLLRAGLPAL